MIRIGIESEIDPLRQVMVHRPGDEVVRMTQHELDLLLFDDILSPAETIREHDLMVEILAGAGAEVIDVEQLLEDALGHASDEARRGLLARCTALAGVPGLTEVLAEWSAERLAHGLICGVYWRDVHSEVKSLSRLRSQLAGGSEAMALRPTPNLMFMRDPGFAVGPYVVPGRMATDARAREPLLVAFAMRHGQRFDDVELLFEPADGELGARGNTIEGGDVLVLSPQVMLVGCSARSTAFCVERLARALFAARQELERVYAVLMPEQRSVMHLDTILTQIDEALFLGHQPMIGTSGSEALAVVRLERSQPPRLVEGATVLDVLRDELGSHTRLVPCGGSDRLHQEREQWTDGANALTLAPGRIILYARNVYTIRVLEEQHGFEEVRLHAVQPPERRAQLLAEGMGRPRTVFSFSGSELSRARGGGRCLTMPLARASR